MEGMLTTTLYDDDFLTKSMNTNSLYDKNALDLSFTDNNNYTEQKVSSDVSLVSSDSNFLLPTSNEASPNLDFLKLGSPDLEQIFMNMENGNDLVDQLSAEAINVSPSKPSSSSSFDMDEDLIGAECYLTDALQQLHDKQTNNPVNPIPLLDIQIKLEEEDTIPTICTPIVSEPKINTHRDRKNYIQPSSLTPRQRKQYGVKLNSQKILEIPQNSSNVIENNGISLRGAIIEPNVSSKNSLLQQHIHQQQQRQQHQQQQRLREQQGQQRQQNFHQSMNNLQIDSNHRTFQHLTEQMVLNNQALIQHQEQQELALLQQAINFQKQQHQQTNLISAQIPSSQHHQKMLQHHMTQGQHQQQASHFHQHDVNNRNRIKHGGAYHQMNDSDITSAVDEQTLKLFVENPHLAPLNLDIQDLIKRERKKLRNRIASSKCRKRKLEREGKLEDKVKVLREKNIELNAVANALKQQICDLKQRVMEHVNEGCQIIMP